MPFVRHAPAINGSELYVPRYDWPGPCKGALTVLKANSGTVVRTVTFPEAVWSVDVCKNYVVGSAHEVYIISGNETQSIEGLAKARRGMRRGLRGSSTDGL